MTPASPTSPPAPRSIAVLTGLPDDGKVRVAGLGQGHRINRVIVPGQAHFVPFFDAETQKRLPTLLFGQKHPLMVDKRAENRLVVNNIADADVCRTSLDLLAQKVAELDIIAFNPPKSIAATTRDQVAAKLAGIRGLVAPATTRIALKDPNNLADEAEAAGISFPLIARVVGTHGGEAAVLVDSPETALDGLARIPWGGRELYLTRFVDYRDDDGRYRKQRLVIVGDQVFLRHHIVADGWHIHSHSRDTASLTEERSQLAAFESTTLPRIRAAIDAIREALDLDYFGIDCSIRPDGSILLFEANAAMNILLNSAPTPNMWEEPVHRIRDALVALLFAPGQWRAYAAEGRP